ncbi:transposase [Stutzerimonas nitrititolerans]|uniref:transposase n=1 Tax=Stutzerimonas nitrititolerans TaxID=2482751 RepID=UPI0035E42253
MAANAPLTTAYLLKDQLKTLWFADDESTARSAWQEWYDMAISSGITALGGFAKRLAPYLEGIMSSTRHRLNTSVLEGMNNQIKVIKRMAYEYQQGLEHRQQEALRDTLHRADELELSDLIDEVDAVEALDATLIALVNRVDAQEAGMAFGPGLSALADGDLDRMGLVDGAAHPLIALGVAQVVEVAVGYPREALVVGIAEHRVSALAELAGGRPREGAVQGIELGEPADIGRGVAPGEGRRRRAAAVAEAPCAAELLDQPGDLRL